MWSIRGKGSCVIHPNTNSKLAIGVFRLSGYPPPHRLAPCQLGFRLKPHLDPDLDMQFRSWMDWKIRILCITDLSISHLSAGAVSKRIECLLV